MSAPLQEPVERRCKLCGCTDDDCRGCIERTGIPCSWSDVEPDLCTACEELGPPLQPMTPTAPTAPPARPARGRR